MHISLENAVDAFIAYMADQVASIPRGVNRWLGFGSLAAIKSNPGMIINNVNPYLEMVGIVKDGMVDLDGVKAFLDNAFANEPKISYFNFTFNAEDAKALLAKMQGVGSEVAE